MNEDLNSHVSCKLGMFFYNLWAIHSYIFRISLEGHAGLIDKEKWEGSSQQKTHICIV